MAKGKASTKKRAASAASAAEPEAVAASLGAMDLNAKGAAENGGSQQPEAVEEDGTQFRADAYPRPPISALPDWFPVLPDPHIDWAHERAETTRVVRQLVASAKPECASDARDVLKKGTIRMTQFPASRAGAHGEPTVPSDAPCAVSWHVNEWAYKKPGLPTMARGLFTRKLKGSANAFAPTRASNAVDEYEVCVRGYDKFFNLDEVEWTRLKELRSPTSKHRALGPFYATVKENGCIVYISAASPTELYVTSKHSLTSEHASVAREWLAKHLASVGRTKEDLALYLWAHRATLVCELADDDFEEHVLAYPKELAGLWLHGVNYNTIELQCAPVAATEPVAKAFGMHAVGVLEFGSLDEMLEYARTHPKLPGHLPGEPDRDIEGYVLRFARADGSVGMSKYKFRQPYLLFREWRELTRALLSGKEVADLRPRHFLSHQYVRWVQAKRKSHPQMFAEYQQSKGMIAVRDAFLRDRGIHPASYRGGGRTVIAPVATVGSGKTTLAKLLAKLAPHGAVAHIQNDNIANKARGNDGKRPFDVEVLSALGTHPVVIADRNNHVRELRAELVASIRESYPDARIVFAVWPVSVAQRDAIYKETLKRIVNRGENHQTLTPERTGNEKLKGVVCDFVYKRDELADDEVAAAAEVPEGHAIVTGHEAEVDRVRVVKLDVFQSPETNLCTLLTEMHGFVPELRSVTVPEGDALAAVLAEVNGEKVKAIAQKFGKRGGGAAQYYALALDGFTAVQLLEQAGAKLPSTVNIKEAEVHVTLVHRNEVDQEKKRAAEVAAEAAAAAAAAEQGEGGGAGATEDDGEWRDMRGKNKRKNNKSKAKHQQQAFAKSASTGSLDPNGPSATWDHCTAAESFDPPASATLELTELRFNDRVAAFRVGGIKAEAPLGWHVPVPDRRVLHVTVGVADKAKAVEANGLFATSQGATVVKLDPPIVVEGVLRGMV